MNQRDDLRDEEWGKIEDYMKGKTGRREKMIGNF